MYKKLLTLIKKSFHPSALLRHWGIMSLGVHRVGDVGVRSPHAEIVTTLQDDMMTVKSKIT